MAWTQTIQHGAPAYVSTDDKAKIYVHGDKFVLHVPGNVSGERVDVFTELAEAQAAYDTGDLSMGLRHQAIANR